MKRTKHLPRILRPVLPVALLAAVAVAGCDDSILFEKSNIDPHPPRIENFVYSPVSVTTGDTVQGTFTYVDEGADIEIFEMRDTGGMGRLRPFPVIVNLDEDEVATASPFFFPVSIGTIEWQVLLESNKPGPHKIRAWLEDSTGSRSKVVEFVVDIGPYGTLPPRL